MGNIAIAAENLGKRYRIGLAEKKPANVREAVGKLASAPFHYLRARLREPTPDELIWALQDISFDINQGEILGIIGQNGAGKSTLLKILSRITEPTSGVAKVYGRVGSLLEVGTGFHPELTGRENIYLNGTILGMRRAEIARKFDEIVEFSGVEKFLDTPVKRYSSGMYVRLAFAVAAHLEPEILLVDEVLAVGDIAFQKKCLGKMHDVSKAGRTVLFVTHNMTTVQELCGRGMLLEHGKLAIDGDIGQVVSVYLQQWKKNLRPFYQQRSGGDQLSPNHDHALLLEAEVLNAEGNPCEYVRFGEPFTIRMVWQHRSRIPGAAYAIRIYDSYGRFLSAVNTLQTPLPIESQGEHHLRCTFIDNVLIPGEYFISIGCYIRPHTTIHNVENCLHVVVNNIPYEQGNVYNIVINDSMFVMPASWEKMNAATE